MSFRPISPSEATLWYKENESALSNSLFDTPSIAHLQISKINRTAKLQLQFSNPECFNNFIASLGIQLERESGHTAQIDSDTYSYCLITDLDDSPEIYGILVEQCPDLETSLDAEFERELKK